MAAPRRPTVEDEDLDDLDDVLEQFNVPPKSAAQPLPVSSSSAPTKDTPTSSTQPTASQAQSQAKNADPLAGIDEDFARELTKGMESLFRDIAQGAGLDDIPDIIKTEEGATDEEREKAFKAAWEAMLIEGMNGTINPEDFLGGPGAAGAGADVGKGKASQASSSGAGAGAGAGATAGAGTDSFQENIKRAMDKLKESDQKAGEAASQGVDGLEDIFSRLRGDMDSEESEEELKGILETMMSQLMSKDVLYEPLKELHDKFPSYMKDNDATLSAEDKTRYVSQAKVVAQIVATFEDPSYADDDPQKGMKVVELMQEMQEYGSPPAEIMGPLPPGFDLGADGLPKLPEGCTIA
ncbi:Pex19-domain-containing protein [Lentinus tigrinus ALCF2SS1-7]|uniref:Pex19-domain-containing protein n=1 Tax=Lentinus tigrinus ALCF2SS1-6 TaxID=1328759 RepID=A0A5C2S199_9APHY|nr:Pex19-domain-containing protein [Lentinus tigrinus ALCF2SS1-6]RPD79566.1 Pex19-domain-containing protein [Lentinus tigrinus ALCF2SS1-7]